MELTIFTPTYNRAYILGNLYHSLQRQTDFRFEWLIIDDGSGDDTDKLVADWQQASNPFTIRYLKVENGGKCRAINRALDLANGRLFFVVDSDDYLTDDAVEVILNCERDIPKSKKTAGILANLGLTETETTNRLLNEKYEDRSLLDRYESEKNLYPLDGERALIIYTDVHKKYKYPVFEGENFMTEAVVWNRMAKDGYMIRVIDKILVVYEYQESGLTKSGLKLFHENPKGYALWQVEKSFSMNEPRAQRLKLYKNYLYELKDSHPVSELCDYLGIPTVWGRLLMMQLYLKNIFM